MTFNPMQHFIPGSGYAVQVFEANGRPVLLGNSSVTNSVYLGGTRGANANLQDVVIVPPLGFVSLDGNDDIYAICATGQSATLQVLPGASYWASGILVASQLIISGGSAISGAFVYSGQPTLGNLVISMTAAGGTDEFGNNYQSGLVVGNPTVGYIRMDLAGKLYFADSSGLTKIFANPAKNYIAFYPTGTGAGKLITSISGNSTITTDDFTNNLYPGIFNAGGSSAASLFMQFTNGQLVFGNLNQLANSWQAVLAAGITPGITQLVSDVNSNTDSPTVLSLKSSANGGSAQVQQGLDNAVYDTCRKTLHNASVQNIASTSMATITGLSVNLGIGTYHLRASLVCTQGGGAFPVITQIAGPAASLVAGYTTMVIEGAGVTVNTQHHGSLPASFTGPAFTAAANFLVTIDLIVTFTAAGSVAVQAAQGSAGHNWSVNAGSILEVLPVTA